MDDLTTSSVQAWSPGMIARFSQTEGGGSLTIITEVIGNEVRSLLVWPEGQEQREFLSPQARLAPVVRPPTLEEWNHVQELTRAYGRYCERLRSEAGDAEARIAAMRRYAIQAYRDNSICRQGLDDFLADNDLPPYRPEYSVRFNCTFDVTVTGEDGSDAA